jgi:hypothetical protein
MRRRPWWRLTEGLGQRDSAHARSLSRRGRVDLHTVVVVDDNVSGPRTAGPRRPEAAEAIAGLSVRVDPGMTMARMAGERRPTGRPGSTS